MKENDKAKPCEKCESYTTGECVSKIPCDMNYSAFKPSKTKKKAGCRPEQQLNKPPDVIEEFVKEGEEHYLFPLHGRFELVKKWINQACTHLEAQAKQIKELGDAAGEDAEIIEGYVDRTEVLQAKIKQLEGEKKRLEEEKAGLLKLTELLDEHPEGYDGPCLCKLCMSYG